MGLLTMFDGSADDPRTQGLLTLGLALMQGRGNFGQALGAAGQQGLSAYTSAKKSQQTDTEQAQKMAMQQQLQAAQIQEYAAQAAQRQAEAQKAQQLALRQQQFMGALSPQVGPAQAMQGGGGPTVAAAQQIGKPAAMDYAALARQFPDQIETIKKLADSQDYGRPEVARTLETMQDGRPVTAQYDKFGRPVGDALSKWVEPKTADVGGKIQGFDPVTGKPLYEFGKSMTPGEVASNRVAMGQLGVAQGQLGISGQRLAFEKSQAGKPQFHDGSWVTPPNAQNPQGTATAVPGFSKPLTETQGNAASFTLRAQNALQNLDSINSISNGDYYKSRLKGGVGNFFMSEQGQLAMNAEKQFIAGLLRKESGAAISQGEYTEYGDQFFPRPGDTAAKLAQKTQNRAIALKGLQIQAGASGAAQAAEVMRQYPAPPSRKASGVVDFGDLK